MYLHPTVVQRVAMTTFSSDNSELKLTLSPCVNVSNICVCTLQACSARLRVVTQNIRRRPILCTSFDVRSICCGT